MSLPKFYQSVYWLKIKAETSPCLSFLSRQLNSCAYTNLQPTAKDANRLLHVLGRKQVGYL